MKFVFISFFILVVGLFGVLKPLEHFVENIISPIQFGLSKSAYNLKESFRFFSGTNRVRQENLELLTTVQYLQDQLANLKLLKDENALLREQLKLEPSSDNMSSLDLVLADVMLDTNSLNQDTVLVNKGSKDGVRQGDMVVIGMNLIGTIKTVGYSRSSVLLLVSPELSFTVYNLDNALHPQGLAKGKHSAYVSIERLLASDVININDTIMTSGKDGIFMPNFVVGSVTKIFEDPSQPLKSAELKTSLDFSRLTKVFIIKLASN